MPIYVFMAATRQMGGLFNWFGFLVTECASSQVARVLESAQEGETLLEVGLPEDFVSA